MNGNARSPSIQRVAIIGAGPIGVSTAKYLVGEKRFLDVDIYEQQSSFGGAWIHSRPQEEDKIAVPQTNPFGPLDRVHMAASSPAGAKLPVIMTPMYDNLETNIPNVLMTFADKGFPDDAPLFPSRTTVMKYLEEHGAEVEHLVRFGSQVTKLQLREGSKGQDSWLLTFKDLVSGREASAGYDAVALANGHFALPSLPEVDGMTKWHARYPGSIMHAKWFRNAEEFAGKRVVIVGNASSGIDIGSQIASVCRPPLILSARSEPLFKLPDHAEHIEVPNIVGYIDPAQRVRAIKLSDGTVVDEVDVVLYCTGYFMNFPFLESKVQKSITSTGYMVHGTYEHLFWREHPTLAFMALPNKVLPMPLGEAQASVVARVWSGRLELPTQAEMHAWELERWRTQGELLQQRGKEINVRSLEKAFHSMGYPQDLNYHNSLVRWAETAGQGDGRQLPNLWGERDYWIRSQMLPIKKAFADLSEQKQGIRTLEDLGFDFDKHKAEEEAQRGLEEDRSIS